MPDETASKDDVLLCHHCGAILTPGEGSLYIVKIEAFADPTPPTVSRDEPLADITAEIDQLIEHMRDMSAQELMDQVYRRLTLFLCWPCYQRWIEAPTG